MTQERGRKALDEELAETLDATVKVVPVEFARGVIEGLADSVAITVLVPGVSPDVIAENLREIAETAGVPEERVREIYEGVLRTAGYEPTCTPACDDFLTDPSKRTGRDRRWHSDDCPWTEILAAEEQSGPGAG